MSDKEKKRRNRSIDYMLSHDLDWYFKYNGRVYHCASNGCIIPESCRELCYLNSMDKVIGRMPFLLTFDDLEINEKYIETVVEQQRKIWDEICKDQKDGSNLFDAELVRGLYLSSFVEKAEKGLIACDTIRLEGGDDGYRYVEVVWPKEELLTTLEGNAQYKKMMACIREIRDERK